MKFGAMFAALLGIAPVGNSTAANPNGDPEHAVIVRFQYGSTDLSRLYALEEKLEAAIRAAKAGEFDGDEVAVDGSDGFLYMYGPSGDLLYESMKPILESCDFMRGAQVTIRYGAANSEVRTKEIRIAP